MTKSRSEINNAYARKAYDRINVLVPKGERDRWKLAASSRGKSLNQFIVDSVEKEMDE